MDQADLQSASTYINNLLLSRGLLRDGNTIDFARLAAPARSKKKPEDGKEADTGRITAQAMNLIHDLILKRDVNNVTINPVSPIQSTNKTLKNSATKHTKNKLPNPSSPSAPKSPPQPPPPPASQPQTQTSTANSQPSNPVPVPRNPPSVPPSRPRARYARNSRA